MVLGALLCMPAALSAGERTRQLVERSEQLASVGVLSASEQRFFAATASLPFLRFITPTSVMDASTRRRIRQRAVEIVETALLHERAGQADGLDASASELRAALVSLRQRAGMQGEGRDDARLHAFVRELREQPGAQGDQGIPTLDEAARLLEKWGVDPYAAEARPYYCALGIRSLGTMGVHATAFCPRATRVATQ